MTDAVADADTLASALARDLPGLPTYEPAVEVTAKDAAHGLSYAKAKRALEKLVADGTWTSREVLVNGRKATAYRPLVKA